MTLTEFGAYDRLLDAYYASEKPLPLEARERYRLAGAVSKSDRDAVDYVVGRYFTEEPDGWHQKRCDEELAAFAERSAKAKLSGQLSGAARRHPKENERTLNERSANVERTLNERSANVELASSHKPVASNQEPIKAKTKVKSVSGASARHPQKTPIADDFSISERVQEWAAKNGHQHLPERLEHFVGKAKASAYRYVDWDEAFMGAIRDDWARLNGKATGAAARLSRIGQKTAQSLQNWIDEEGVRDVSGG